MEQVDREQVTKAVEALQQVLQKKRASAAKQALVEDANVFSLIVTRNTVPPKSSLKPILIDLPHSIRADGEACLFVKDADKKRIKEALAQDPVDGLTKVMGIKKLKKHFGQFKDRRELKASFATFLADDRVLPYLKTLLGKTFFDAKKQPRTVDVSAKNVSDPIRRVLAGTAMFVSTGPCFNVKIAHDGLELSQIVDNIIDGTEIIVSYVPKKWKNIKSISIKTNDSMALPIYNALPNSAKLPTEINIKRKSEDISTEAPAAKKAKQAEEETKAKEAPAKKEAVKKATPVKEAAKEEVAKEEAVPAKKEAAPAKKEAAPAKKAAAAKKVVPVKKAAPKKVAAAAPAKKTTRASAKK
ncbi:hypothetical protein SDRG_09122 [Saprolegnia diclina VS20]|uniref:Ribosomal protein L1 n=1 Tax=Saprolegnia diclina (strain VS20) TaxID=1156394 RepID=T0QHI5_SAPDV|nr:hypothetical protein SDRG_09122 [Saprolegnia diclina VS20]EQC33135.1 hypothetical protein SDRG_09122 [Saprolegnia diclina VS20]|eukprot:XP_008613258.1 hypothetical protein SDRG_09122 [Saprolegnia diclina VS20]